jgi:rhamnosyltransferase
MRRSVSVILPTRNNAEYIAQLLESIFAQSYAGSIEVLVMDSSDDATPQIAAEYASKYDVTVTRVEPMDYNYGGTRNLGATMTSGEILVFLSTDVEIRDPGWLKKLVRNLAHPRVAGVYGRQVPKEGASPMEEYFIQYRYPDRREEYVLRPGGKLRDWFFSNNNSAMQREVWTEFPLPEMLKSEEQEWAKRVILAGYRVVYEPAAVVFHSHHYSLMQVFREYFDSGATLAHVYNGDSRVAVSGFLERGLSYEVGELKYFANQGYVKSIPYALVYDLLKFLGYMLGTKQRYMPVWLKKVLCKKANHWNRYDDIIRESSLISLFERSV